jgi:pimeloyl-ACP methyl ester carboxylesterase
VIPAASKRSAYTAAPALRRFSAGLETEVRPDANTTLIGHSYGSVVVGHALRHGARFDNVILTGSPGIDPDVHSVAELGVPGTRFFAARSPGDFVSYTRPGFVTRDQGPINPGALFDGSGPPTVCSVTVETGDPSRTDLGAEQVAAAGRVLRERGWQVEPPELEAGHHRVAATRAGFEVAIHAWDGDWKVTLVGETPLPE